MSHVDWTARGASGSAAMRDHRKPNKSKSADPQGEGRTLVELINNTIAQEVSVQKESRSQRVSSIFFFCLAASLSPLSCLSSPCHCPVTCLSHCWPSHHTTTSSCLGVSVHEKDGLITRTCALLSSCAGGLIFSKCSTTRDNSSRPLSVRVAATPAHRHRACPDPT